MVCCSQDLSGITTVFITACVFLYNIDLSPLKSRISVCQVREDSLLAFCDTEAYKASGRDTNRENKYPQRCCAAIRGISTDQQVSGQH